MACNCTEKIEKDTKVRYGAVRASLEHFGSQRSEVAYRPYTAEGRPSKHNRYTSVEWVFCPFCGKKIKQ